MVLKGSALLLLLVGFAGLAWAQAPGDPGSDREAPRSSAGANKWRAPTGAPPRSLSNSQNVRRTSGEEDGIPAGAPLGASGAAGSRPRQPIARVTEGSGVLPNDAGQVWREYDITPYVVRVTSTNRPEQAIVDWILRDTGYEAWHSEPLGFLSVNRRTLRVYHTPQMQSAVADVVDRFVNTEAETSAFSLRVITIGHPDWRVKAKPMLKPLAVQTQGIQAWLLAREDAALLMNELRKRTDFREHSSPHLLVNNGQSTTVASTRPRTFTRDITLRPEAWPAYEPELGQFDEGFSLELSPLLSLDGNSIDAVIKCNIDQLERLVPVMLDVPTRVASGQRAKVEVPQITHCRLHERFRWPTDHILLVGLGVVATPVPADPSPLRAAIPWTPSPSRADLLVVVEAKGKLTEPTAPAPNTTTTQRDMQRYRGRY
ncbi:MAG TPA: hypothetical protein VGJ26_01160 [Pirellulales bacterium]